jgi:acyl carrier protein
MNQMTAILHSADDASVIAPLTAQVMDIIAHQAMIDRASIAPDTQLSDMALDSLVMVEIVFALEESFGLTIPFNANAGATMSGATTSVDQAGFDMSTPASIAAAIFAATGAQRAA